MGFNETSRSLSFILFSFPFSFVVISMHCTCKKETNQNIETKYPFSLLFLFRVLDDESDEKILFFRMI